MKPDLAARRRARDLYRQLSAHRPRLSPHAEDGFERIEKLGAGGMAEVWRVRDRRLGREAALKYLHHGRPQKRRAERFRRELAITAGLEHPGIPPIYEAGESPAGRDFLVMRAIEGRTLAALIEDLEVPSRRLLEHLRQASEAVAYAHNRGVIHRDLKPENLMVGRFGEVAVLDWGLARSGAEPEAKGGAGPEAAGLTEDGAIMGTLGYMAPEQADGEPATPRSDVYALGVMIAEAVLRRPLIEGDRTARLVATLEGRAEKALEGAELPPELASLARRCLATRPRGRPKDASTVASELAAYLSGAPLRSHRYSVVERSLRAAQRHPNALLAFIAVAVIAATAELGRGWLAAARAAESAARASAAAAGLRRDAAREGQRRIQEALALMRAAEREARRPSPEAETAARKIEQALSIAGRDEGLLIRAAGILRRARSFEAARSLLEEAIAATPPAYAALYELHRVENAERGEANFRLTPALNRLIEAAEARGEENQFTRYSAALNAISEGRHAAAEALIEAILAETPRFGAAWHLRGLARQYLGDSAGALEALNRAAALQPLDAEIYINRTNASMAVYGPQGALEDCERAVELGPRIPDAFYNRSNIYFQLGRPREAFADLDRAIALAPNFAKAYNNRGFQRGLAGDVAGALRDLDQALAIRPAYPLALLNRGNLFFRSGAFPQALADYDAAIRLDPRSFKARVNRAGLRAQTGDIRGALEDYRAALAIAPKHPSADALRHNLSVLESQLKR